MNIQTLVQTVAAAVALRTGDILDLIEEETIEVIETVVGLPMDDEDAMDIYDQVFEQVQAMTA